MYKKIPLLLFLHCMAPLSLHAAQVRWEPAPEGDFDSVGTIFADGPIEAGDAKKILKALDGNQGAKGAPLYLQLNSDGGSFDEAIRISKIAQTSFLTTKLAAHAKCVSACAIVFMSGLRPTTSTVEKSRIMSPTAILGFHAPTVSVTGGKVDTADIEAAYGKAIEQVGGKLNELARFRDHSWTSPLIKSALLNEMMNRRGGDFFYIDTISKVAEFEIELLDARKPPKIITENRKNACQNALAAFADANVAADAAKSWLAAAHEVKLSKSEARRDGDSDEFESQPDTETYRFMVNRSRGELCDVAQNTDETNDGELLAGVDVSTRGDRIPVSSHDWFLWPSDMKLNSLPAN